MTGRCQGEELSKGAEIGRTLAHFGTPPEAAIETSQSHGVLAFMAAEQTLRKQQAGFSGPRTDGPREREIKSQKYWGGGRRRTFRIAGIVPALCECRRPRSGGISMRCLRIAVLVLGVCTVLGVRTPSCTISSRRDFRECATKLYEKVLDFPISKGK